VASLRARAQQLLGPALLQALLSVCSASLLELAGANTRRCRRRGEIHGCGHVHGFLPCACVSLCWRLHLRCSASSLDTSVISFPAPAASPQAVKRGHFSSLLRLDHFYFHVCRDFSSAVRLRTRRDFMSLLLTKILVLICLPSPCSSLCVTLPLVHCSGCAAKGLGKSCLLPWVCAVQPDPGSGR